jgi:hypothetical protein
VFKNEQATAKFPQREEGAMTMTKKNSLPIDKRTAAVLKAKGFTISDDGEVAKIDGEMTLDIMRLVGGELRLSIDLPDGQVIGATVVDLHEEQLGKGVMIPPLRDGSIGKV